MTDLRGASRVVAAVLAVVLLGGTVTGCASEEPPGQAVPAVAERLDQVDSAIRDGDLEVAAEAVRQLIAEATRAREDGRLDPDDAANVVQAAETLLQELESDVEGEQVPDDTTTVVPEPEATADDDEGNGAEDEEKKDEKDKDEEKDDDEGEEG